jgi:major intracellular serine protease
MNLADYFTALIESRPLPIHKCDSRIVVAVIDTGLDINHPYIKDSLYADKPGWDFTLSAPISGDVNGHGTHVSGIIGGKPDRSRWISGICPGVTIMPLRFHGSFNVANTIKAIRFAAKEKVQIINYSAGGLSISLGEKDAIDEARKAGVVVIVSAGNESSDLSKVPFYPASLVFDNMIVVSAVDGRNLFVSSSNFGRKVDVAAGGLSIMSSMPGGKWGTMTGTSQATASVSGAVALILSQFPALYGKIPPQLIVSAMCDSAKPMIGVRCGIVDVPKTIQTLRRLLHESP